MDSFGKIAHYDQHPQDANDNQVNRCSAYKIKWCRLRYNVGNFPLEKGEMN